MKKNTVINLFAVLALFWTSASAQEQKAEIVVQTGHTDIVHSVAFSPDGRIAASGSEDKAIKLWDVASRQEVRTLEHKGVVRSVAFSPDSRIIAAGGDLSITLWDVVTGKKINTFTGHTNSVMTIAFSFDGKFIASGSHDETVKIWDIASGREIKSLKHIISRKSIYPNDKIDALIESIAFSPDGKTLASSIFGEKTVKLWDIASGQEIASFVSANDIELIAFSPDGKILAGSSGIGGDENTVFLWDAASKQELKALRHTDTVNSIAFSPDGKMFASVTNDNIVKLWDVLSGQEIKSFKVEEVYKAAFSNGGETLLLGGADGKVSLWDIASGHELKSLGGGDARFDPVGISPDGKMLALRSFNFIKKLGAVKLWNIASEQEPKLLAGHTSFITSVVFSPDSKTLATGSDDKTIKLWNVEIGREIITISGSNAVENSVAFSPDGKIIASSGGDLVLWNAETGKRIKTLMSTEARIFPVVFSPDGKMLASGSGGELIKNPGIEDALTNPHAIIRLWDVASGKEVRTFKGHTDSIETIAFSRDGQLLATGSDDKTVKLWNVATGEELQSLKGHTDPVGLVAFSADGKTLISGINIEDSVAKLWDTASGKELKSLQRFNSFTSREIYAIAPDFFQTIHPITRDGKFQFINDANGKIGLYEVGTGKLVASLIALGENDWAVITPEGLFDGTPSAWKQLIWRLDNNTFNFVPVEAFFKEFYRPGLLQEIMQGKTPTAPAKDLSQIDIRQPKVEITSIDQKSADSSIEVSTANKTITVKIEVTDNTKKGRRDFREKSSGANDLRLFRNGSLVKIWKKTGAQNDKQVSVFDLNEADGCQQIEATKDAPRKAICETKVAITAGKNNFTAYAFNNEDVKSADAIASIEGKFAKREGALYVLAIGVNKYANADYNLNFAVPDVVDMGNAIKQEQASLAKDKKLKQYAKTEIITLKDETATRENILLALDKFAKTSAKMNLPENLCVKLTDNLCAELKAELGKIKPTEPEDALVIYFAGHGVSRGERFYILPHNFTGTNGEKSFSEQGVSDVELNDYLEKIDAGRLLMAIDACQSGGALGAKDAGRAPMNSKGLAQLAYDKGMYILTAAQSQEAALEAVNIGGKEIRHGLLTYALLEGLKNPLADKDANKQLWEREWLDFATEQVPQLQREAMRQRHIEISRGLAGDKARSEIIYINGDSKNKKPEDRTVQTPRVFYKREASANPFIVTKP